jgi:hypothetical protein
MLWSIHKLFLSLLKTLKLGFGFELNLGINRFLFFEKIKTLETNMSSI